MSFPQIVASSDLEQHDRLQNCLIAMSYKQGQKNRKKVFLFLSKWVWNIFSGALITTNKVVSNVLPARTKEPTQEMNPERKELNGNVPTKRQYRNCTIPVSMT